MNSNPEPASDDPAAPSVSTDHTDEKAVIAAKLAEAEAWIASSQRERKRLDGYSYRGSPCDRVNCALRPDRSNGQPLCWCSDSDGYPQPLYLAETPYAPLEAGRG